ncbi:hypothetical protein HAX54_004542 [Datura stramonium]|uniref:Uncharacterized protein n=1 Tax=Datura stramonium TaxID=4076 RepID=A0ABS8T9F8_DATST|nr:hypothetical protein [Datura stramonium]
MNISPSIKPPSTAPPAPMNTSSDIPQSQPNIPDVPLLASLPPPVEGEVGSLMASLTGGSSYSMEIAPSPPSLSPEDELTTGPSSPHVEVDLPSLIANIRGRYVLPDLAPVSLTLNRASRSPTSFDPENMTVLARSSSEFDNADELVPLLCLSFISGLAATTVREQDHSESVSSAQEEENANDEGNDPFWLSEEIPVEAKNILDGATCRDSSLTQFVKAPANLVVLEGDCLVLDCWF